MKLRINDMEHKEEKTLRRARRKNTKNEDNVRSLWDNCKHTNIHIIGVLEEEKQQEIGNLFEKNNKRKLP